MQQRGWGALSTPVERGRSKKLITMQTFSKQRLEWQMGQQRTSDKLLPEIGQIEDHKAHLLSQ
jgi:hypothetical protein